VSDEPVEAIRAHPGEYLLATDHVETGMRFRYRDAVYEVVGEPRGWGYRQWMATIRVVEGLRPGAEFRALLRGGEKVS